MVNPSLLGEKLPQTIIAEGDMLPTKRTALRSLAAQVLFRHRRETPQTEEDITTLIAGGNHPDMIEFTGETVLIGPEKDPAPGTVRHLMRKILPYAPWKSNARVVIFYDAAGIKDEAETALLKTLEEPPANHYFFLSVQNAELLKETIRSRSALMRLSLPSTAVSNEPWERFYDTMGAGDFIADYVDTAKEITAQTRAAFDEMSYSQADFTSLERILFTLPKKLTEKENLNVQNRALKFAILPFWAALRDISVQGRVPALAPVAMSRMSEAHAIEAARLIRHYLGQLEYRVFGNRPLNQQAIFYSFFFRFFHFWAPERG